ncbi:MFS transporter [Salmonella enterica subsp. enterica serovar Portland]|uniref:Major facilitator superfamily (MFS) profile domain-containing protein n=1 Tax=Salmonella enterica subsp. indica serovar 6,14,25:z10:1,(2),7 str. 1121 TaxID=1173950 RepID=V1HZG1_SALER|nr:sugar efflux transporter [Salmonella enterica]EBF8124624.1 MFS transporter [Salmonella enterica subsp. enterica]EBY5127815.1 MFS transporter [Salmonella enterica subsp. enterica serovar Brazzaville]ECA8970342.1 MFS transporter [Salmonella enterica subsp. enterica serovar Omuna]EDH5629001.1 MFS transporter [Salmonella enterica subsp. enterica serovar Claibornei]EEB9697096.1 MFS transporter [Salmonella enterica subsp. enterica serovar Miami]EEF3249949.1 MFS transporter [Salmonella enterica s
MLWITTMGRRLNGIYAAFMLVAFMMGVAGALQAPTLSLFLSREVGAQPFWVGLFYTVNAIVGIGVSLALAKRSDSRGDRRKLIMFCCLMAIGNALLFAFNRHYLTLITCGVLLASLANTAMPQLFALAREYADSSAREVVMFSSVMRAQLSLAWVIGPPLAFMLALNYGFTVMFSIAAVIFAVSLVLIALMLPSVARVEQPVDAPLAQVNGWQDRNVRMLFIASTLMWTCNTMYIIDMPLWISAELGLSDKLAGVLMGTAAGLEIPAMILAGFYVKRFGKRRMMIAAVAAGVLFYVGLIFFHSRTALLLLQLFNAVFIGIVAGIGMLWFQDLMPGRAGAATTLFTNSISTGIILAGVIQGAVAQSFGHFAVYWVIAAISVVTLVMTGRVKDV